MRARGFDRASRPTAAAVAHEHRAACALGVGPADRAEQNQIGGGTLLRRVGGPIEVAEIWNDANHPTLGPWQGSNSNFGASTTITGVTVVAGTRTVLFVGSNGLGPYCYGDGTADKAAADASGGTLCYDPANSSKGQHTYPYRYQIWAYDLNDFAAVKAGSKQPWEVVPYGVWPLTFPTPERTTLTGGVGYDPQTQTLYVSQLHADQIGYGLFPVIHAFRLNAAPGSAATAPSLTSGVSLTANKTAPQAIGTAVEFVAQPTGGVAPHQYKWVLFDGVSSRVLSDWTTSNRYVWTPTSGNPSYRVGVWVRGAGNTADVLEASASMPFAISDSAKTSSVALTANRVAPQAPFTAITWTAVPTGGVAPHQYKWRVFDGTAWTVSANWSPTNSFVWTPSTANANYRVEVWVRGAGSSADVAEASTASPFPIETSITADTIARVTSVSLIANRPAPHPAGDAVSFTATPAGGTAPLVYKWFYFTGTTWTAFGNWSSSQSFTWYPSEPNANYRIRVWVKSSANGADQAEASAELPFAITSGTAPSSTTPVSSVKLTSNKSSPQGTGAPITFTATPSGGTGPFVYKWSVTGSGFPLTAPWFGSNTFTWTPMTADNNYRVSVSVKRASNLADQAEATAELRFNITNGKGNGKP